MHVPPLQASTRRRGAAATWAAAAGALHQASQPPKGQGERASCMCRKPVHASLTAGQLPAGRHLEWGPPAHCWAAALLFRNLQGQRFATKRASSLSPLQSEADAHTEKWGLEAGLWKVWTSKNADGQTKGQQV